MIEYLRKAVLDDCDMIYHWVNDAKVRENSFYQEQIPYEEHVRWFQKKLEDTNCDFYIYMREDHAIGEVRIDWSGDVGEISYLVGKEYRCQGYGIKFLKIVGGYYGEGKILVGHVKKENLASQKCFERNGYSKVSEQENIKYVKRLNSDEISSFMDLI